MEQMTEEKPNPFDATPEQEEDRNTEYSSISDSEGYNPNALYCICRQKHNKRFMICCDSCQDWFHGSCVGITEAQGRKMERSRQDYICPNCNSRNQSLSKTHQSLPERLSLPLIQEKEEDVQSEPANETPAVQEAVGIEEMTKVETESSLSGCIGPGCPKHALPESVYCSTDCIVQHAAATMKTLSDSKEPKLKARPQRKAAAKVIPKGQRSGRMTRTSAGQLDATETVEDKEEEEDQEEAKTSSSCDPKLTPVQATPIASSMFYKASDKDSEQVEAESVPVTLPRQPPDATPCSESPSESSLPLGGSPGKTTKPVHADTVSRKAAVDLALSPQSTLSKSNPSPALETPGTSTSRHHDTGALKISKTAFIIPKKQHESSPSSVQQPPSAGSLLGETRTLPVSPAPIAPSSRPSQPNNQVRQSIQRSLTSILFKRVCDCDDLVMSESDVGKLVTNIEMEMFDIFRNTDSKYMNKYRTIMFNIKDPKNKGLLYRVVRGEISPFRLARMSQRDMQATKVPEISTKVTEEESGTKAPCLQLKPEMPKMELPSLTAAPSRTNRNIELKKTLPPPLKARPNRPSQSTAVPDILNCMLKDTTAEHRTHLFDLKCKICTGQITTDEEEEPEQKKTKFSASSSNVNRPSESNRDRQHYGQSWMYGSSQEGAWKTPAGDESPLLAPPDSPVLDSPVSLVIDPRARPFSETPASVFMDSPASPVLESPASPMQDSPSSPINDSPASPTQDNPIVKAPTRAYTPVMIPAVSTVTITRRDPRTAGNRPSATATVSSTPAPPTSVSYVPVRETVTWPKPALPLPPSLPPPALPKSILMKPTSSADARFYGASGSSSSAVNSHSPPDGETAQFLAKQDITWKGFLNMVSVAKFVTKGYLVSGSPDCLKMDLPDTIQIGGRISPQTVWEYVARVRTSVTKELCVIRFHPATEEEEVAYVSLFSYFSSRKRFGVVANNNRSIKDLYLVPLSAKEVIPSKLQPLDGPGLEKNRPNLLLGLAICQRPKRPGNTLQESEEKRPKIQMAKDPRDTGLPKPPVLYGSDKLEMFQPYDPETPIFTASPSSPPSVGSPSDSSSSGSITIPSLLASNRTLLTSATPPASASAPISATISEKNTPSSSSGTSTTSTPTNPLQTILSTLFGKKTNESASPAVSSSPVVSGAPAVSALPLPPPPPMVDPIVQQYGQKSKVTAIKDEETDFDRPYDPEEEYDPVKGYRVGGLVRNKKIQKNKTLEEPTIVDDGVAYDPEDETIFEVMKNHVVNVAKAPPTPDTIPAPNSTPAPVPASPGLPGPVPVQAPLELPGPVAAPAPHVGTVVVSAATLTEQQRMLEELNKQIEEQKRQLKEQEEALRQQREAVGMFMAHFSVSDALMSPPPKSGPANLNQPSASEESETKHSDVSNDQDRDTKQSLTIKSVKIETSIKQVTVKQEIETETLTVSHADMNDVEKSLQNDLKMEKDEDSNSTTGEIEDSDVAYDPEDESIFDEIRGDIKGERKILTRESSVSSSCRGASHKDISPGHRGPSHERRRRESPKKRGRKPRDYRHSPPHRLSRRSPGRNERRKERHRRGDRDRSGHRARDHSEHSGRHLHRKDRNPRRRSSGRRRSPSSSRRKNDSASASAGVQKRPFPHGSDTSKEPVAPQNTGPDGSVSGPLTECTNSAQPFLERQNEDKTNADCSESDPVGSQQGLSENTSPPISHGQTQQFEDQQPSHNKVEAQMGSKHQNNRGGSLPREVMGQVNDQGTSENQRLSQGPYNTAPKQPIERCRGTEAKGSDRRDEALDVKGVRPLARGMRGPDNEGHPTRGDLRWSGMREQDVSMKNTDPGSCLKDQGVNEPEIRMPGLEMKGPVNRGLGVIDPGPHFGGLGLRRENICNERTSQAIPVSEFKFGQMGPAMKEPHIGSLESEMGFRGTELDGRGSDFKGTGPNFRGPCPDMSGPIPAFRCPGPDFRDPGPDFKGPGPDMRGRGPDFRGPGPDMTGPDFRGLGTDFRGPGPDFRDPGPDIRGPGPDFRGSGPGFKGPGPDMRGLGPDMRGPGPDFRRPGSDFKAPGPDRRGPGSDRRGPGSDIGGPGPDFRGPGPDFRGPGSDFRGPGSDFKGPGPDRRGPASDIRGPGPDFRGPGPDRRGPASDIGGPGSDFKGPGPDRRGPGPDFKGPCPDMRGPGSDIRGPGPDFKGSGPDRRGPGPDRRGPGPDFKGPYPDMRGPGPDIIGPGPDFRGPGPDVRDPGQDLRGPGSDFRGPCPDMRSPGPDFRGPGPHFRGTGPNFRSPNPDMRGSGTDMRGPEHDFRGHHFRPSLTERGHLSPDMTGPGQGLSGPDIRGLNVGARGAGLDERDLGSNMPGEGPDIREARLDMRDPGPALRGGRRRVGVEPEVRHRISDIRAPGMKGLCPDTRSPGPDILDPDKRSPGPDTRVSNIEDGRDPGLRHPGSNRSLRGGRTGPANREPHIEFQDPGPDVRGLDIRGEDRSSRPDFRRRGSDRGAIMRGRRPGRGLGSGIRGRGSGRGLEVDHRGSWSDSRGHVPDRELMGQGSHVSEEELDVRGPGPDIRGIQGRRSDIRDTWEGPDPDTREEWRRSGPQTRDEWREPNPEARDGRTGSVADITNKWSGPGLTRPDNFKEKKGLEIREEWRGPGPRDPDQCGRGSDRGEWEGPEKDMRDEWRRTGPNVREEWGRQGPDLSRPDIRGSSMQEDRRDSGLDMRGIELHGGDPDLRDEWRGPGPHTRSPCFKEDERESCPRSSGQGPRGSEPVLCDRGPNLREEWSTQNTRQPEIDMGGPHRRGTVWKDPADMRRHGPDFRGESREPAMKGPEGRKDRKGSDIRGIRPNTRDQDISDIEMVRYGPNLGGERRGSDLDRDPDSMGPGPGIREERRGPNFRGPRPDMGGSDIRGHDMRDDRRGPNFRDSGPDMGGPDFRGPEMGGPDFRGPDMEGPDFRGPDMREDRRGPNFRGPRPDMGGPDFRGPDLRDDRGGPNFRGPRPEMGGPDFRGPDMEGPDFRGPDMRDDRGGPNFRGPRPDMGGPDFRGPDLRDERGGPNFRGAGPDIGGPDFRGPDMREDRKSPNFRGVGPDMGGPDFRGPDMRGPDFRGPDMRGPDFRGPDMREDRRGPNFRGPRSGIGGSDFRGPDMGGPDFRGLDMREDRKGPDFRGPGRDMREPDFEGPGPDLRGPDFRGPGPDMRRPDFRGPGPDMRRPEFRGRPVPDMRRSEFKRPGPDMMEDREGQDFGGQGPNIKGSEFRGPGPRDECSGPDLRAPGFRGRGTDIKSKDFRGSGSDIRDPSIRKESRSPDTSRLDKWEERVPHIRGHKMSEELRPRRSPSPDFPLSHQRGHFETQRRGHSPGFPGPSVPHPLPFSRPRGTSPGHFTDSGGKPRFGFDGPLKSGVQMMKHKTPLLPTPTEALNHLPHHMVNSSARSSEERASSEENKRGQVGIHGRDWNRGRQVSLERENDRGAIQQEGRQKGSCRDRDTERQREEGKADPDKARALGKDTTKESGKKLRDGEQEKKEDNVKLTDIPQDTQDKKGSS